MKVWRDRHLTYCTNIHPGEEWQKVFANLQQYVPALKAQLAPTAPFGIGLRLADIAARELLQGDTLAHFQAWLSEQNLYVFTLNGFPYGEFHRQVVKDQVYAPDWSMRSRLDYTVRLIHILTALLPEGLDGGISTVPLSYKPWHRKDLTSVDSVLRDCCSNLATLTAEMSRLQTSTGRLLHLDLEPEPDGFIENTAEVIHFFHNWLLPVGGATLAQQLGVSQAQAETKLLNHIRICYDTCHFAVEYEDPAAVFARLQTAGIQIGKIQLSAAIKATLPDHDQALEQVDERLQPFAESTYLHQVIERQTDGTLHHYSDLELALAQLRRSPLTSHRNRTFHQNGLPAREWRIHFHVPIFIQDYQILQSTQDEIETVLQLLNEYSDCKHLEIETYTWDVSPTAIKTDLLTSIQREYEWVLSTISKVQTPRFEGNASLIGCVSDSVTRRNTKLSIE